MTDSATTRNRFRKQSLGSNTNTWGDTKLNEDLDVIDQAMDGVLSIALTGDYTLVTTNYTTADEAKRRVIKFTGALTAAAAVTVPSVEHEYNIINSAGATVTVKTSAGTGVAIPTGYQARVYCDAVNVYNGSPTLLSGALTVAGQIHAVTAGTSGTDAVNVTQMAAAIAASVPAGTAGTVFNSVLDTTRDYLATKLTFSGSLVATTSNPGANETRDVTFTFDEGQAALYAGVYAL